MKRHHMVPFLENPQFTGGYLLQRTALSFYWCVSNTKSISTSYDALNICTI